VEPRLYSVYRKTFPDTVACGTCRSRHCTDAQRPSPIHALPHSAAPDLASLFPLRGKTTHEEDEEDDTHDDETELPGDVLAVLKGVREAPVVLERADDAQHHFLWASETRPTGASSRHANMSAAVREGTGRARSPFLPAIVSSHQTIHV